MSRRREIGRKLDALTDIAGILSAMKNLALMETHVIEEFLDSQRRTVASIETAAADFLAWHPEYRASSAERGELCVLIGSEQGFCGDFNETIEGHIRELSAHSRAPDRWVLIGLRLAERLGDHPSVARTLPGATVADEVPPTLLRLTRELTTLLTTEDLSGHGLSVLYHDDATGGIRLQRLLPLSDLQPPPAHPFGPDLNLSGTEFFEALTDHYLFAVLHEVLYSALMAENRARLAHMDRALDRLNEDTARLRLAYNAQRQEEITEEIEVILLSADMMVEND